MKLEKNKGFTLMELLVVMTIMAVLMGLALVSYQGARRTARDGKRKSDLEEIRGALEMYRTDLDAYPGNLGVLGGYIDVPVDPATGANYFYSSSDDAYILCAILEIPGTDTCSGCADCDYRTTNP